MRMFKTDVEGVQAALKAARRHEAENQAWPSDKALLVLAEAAQAVVAMEMFCICGAGPDGEPHTPDCPIAILAAMLKETP